TRDIATSHGKGIEEKEKDRKEGGWSSKWISGSHVKDKDRDHRHVQRERSQLWQQVHPEEEGALTSLIGFLIATISEDWALVLDVCERASASNSNAKEAIWALRIEFKYGHPQAQLGAARLWAIMLRNSTDTFISQSTSRKFLETLEELLLSSRTNPVVKERVMDVLAAAAYASGSKKDTGFRGLWKKVKPPDKPDEGMPFDTDDAMFNPPTGGDRRSAAESLPYQQPQLHLNHHHIGQQQHTQQDQNQPSNSQHCKTGSLSLQEDATKGSSKDSLSGIDGSSRPSRYRQERKPSDARYTPPLTFDNLHSERAREDGEEEGWSNLDLPLVESANNPPSTSGHSEDSPITPHTTTASVCDTPPPFVLPSRSDSPIARPLSAVSSATTVPPYTQGGYSPRSWRDTLASAQTYETLPSYHSRRSTRTLTIMAPIPTTRNVRPLPPIPPLPSFVS
ncbi:hypothetical protein PQX77_017478, partial [Marasmius sp. AFHP31]